MKKTREELIADLYVVGIELGSTRDAVLSAWPVGSSEHTAARIVQGDLSGHVRQIIAERNRARAEADALRQALKVANAAIRELTKPKER